MKHLIVLLLATVSISVTAQTAYEKGMQKALGLWSEGKSTEAVAMFERIAGAEKDNWLPNYYVALVSTTTAFNIKDKTQVDALLKKAQTALDVESVSYTHLSGALDDVNNWRIICISKAGFGLINFLYFSIATSRSSSSIGLSR